MITHSKRQLSHRESRRQFTSLTWSVILHSNTPIQRHRCYTKTRLAPNPSIFCDFPISSPPQQASAKEGSKKRLSFVKLGASAYQKVADILKSHVRVSQESQAAEVSPDDEIANLEKLSAALYDLGLNYLLRSRLVCADAGEGSGLWEQHVYLSLPEVLQLTRYCSLYTIYCSSVGYSIRNS